jgi:hypothetical protein
MWLDRSPKPPSKLLQRGVCRPFGYPLHLTGDRTEVPPRVEVMLRVGTGPDSAQSGIPVTSWIGMDRAAYEPGDSGGATCR